LPPPVSRQYLWLSPCPLRPSADTGSWQPVVEGMEQPFCAMASQARWWAGSSTVVTVAMGVGGSATATWAVAETWAGVVCEAGRRGEHVDEAGQRHGCRPAAVGLGRHQAAEVGRGGVGLVAIVGDIAAGRAIGGVDGGEQTHRAEGRAGGVVVVVAGA